MNAAEIHQLFTGKKTTPAEIQRLMSAAQAMGLRPGDPMLLLLSVLDAQQSVIAGVPKALKESAEAMSDEAKRLALANTYDALQGVVRDSVKQVSTELTKQIDGALDSAVKARQRRILGTSILFAFVTVSVVFGAGLWAGRGLGYDESKDEKAAASWATTPNGQLAFQLEKNGELASLVHCNKSGWEIKKGICYPQPDAARQISGWKMPK